MNVTAPAASPEHLNQLMIDAIAIAIANARPAKRRTARPGRRRAHFPDWPEVLAA